jgi:phosphate starvation-inducible PhoH-like protein
MPEAATSGRFVVDLPHPEAVLALSGPSEQTLRQLESLTGVSLVIRGLQLDIVGRPRQLERAAAVVEVLARSQRGQLLRPRTLRQKTYVEAMERHDLTFALGPAGTGKTFLATVLAVRMLSERKVERLILTRPAVEAGERLGFLPGDLQQKVDPYLRPLYDALHALMGPEKTAVLLEKGVIEVAPLAYMRGRTLAEAFVILDEAQNTTPAQMRMVLTRLGERSRMVVTGDITQVDLPLGQLSGLVEAAEVLDGVEGVAVCRLTAADVVRHPLVQRVVEAYARRDKGGSRRG